MFKKIRPYKILTIGRLAKRPTVTAGRLARRPAGFFSIQYCSKMEAALNKFKGLPEQGSFPQPEARKHFFSQLAPQISTPQDNAPAVLKKNREQRKRCF